MENYLRESELRTPKLRVRKVVSESFAVLGEKPGMFLFLAVLCSVIGVLEDASQMGMPISRTMRFFFPIIFGSVKLVFIAVISAAAYEELSGGSIGLKESLRRGMRSYISLFCVCLPFEIVGGLYRYLPPPPRILFRSQFFDYYWWRMLLMILFIYVGIALYTVIPVCVAEGLTAVKAFKRSLFLTRGYRAKVFILCFFYRFAVMLLRGYAAKHGIILAVLNILDNAFDPIMAVCLYFMLRIKKERWPEADSVPQQVMKVWRFFAAK